MLRNIRILLAAIFFTGITLLFLDFTGEAAAWFGWMAKAQFLPAVFALNFVVIFFLLLATILFGRIYCSTLCPLGVFQDIVSWSSGKIKKRRFSWSPASPVRYVILFLFICAILVGINSLAVLIAPYSAYGRMAQNLLAPLWEAGNNLLAWLAEKADSYVFYERNIYIKSMFSFIVAAATALVILILSWRNGRAWCNIICPVGTILSFFSRFAWLRPVINNPKCNKCGTCSRACKASCIDSKAQIIDYSRCVACMNCISVCPQGAISYKHKD